MWIEKQDHKLIKAHSIKVEEEQILKLNPYGSARPLGYFETTGNYCVNGDDGVLGVYFSKERAELVIQEIKEAIRKGELLFEMPKE